MSGQRRRLTRSRDHRLIAGVCGGIAAYFDIDSTIIRLAYVLLSIFSAAFPGIIVYIIAMFLMPVGEDGGNDGPKGVDYTFVNDPNKPQ